MSTPPSDRLTTQPTHNPTNKWWAFFLTDAVLSAVIVVLQQLDAYTLPEPYESLTVTLVPLIIAAIAAYLKRDKKN